MWPNPEEAVTFLEGWRPGGPWVLTAIPPEGGATRTVTLADPGAVRKWIHDHSGGRWNLYFTVNETAGPVRKKPEKADMAAATGLHVDVDPRPGEVLDAERERALRLLRAYSPAPTAIVDSGGGYQDFWKAEEPVPLDGDAAHIERRNLRIETDLQADACHNIDRLMRLPGTVNWPSEKKRKKGRVARLASVVDAEWRRTYRLAEFPEAEVAKTTPAAGGPCVELGDVKRLDSLDDLPATISARTRMLIVNGGDPDDPSKYPSRSEVLFAVLCEMIRAGVDDDVMAAVILDPEYGISAHVLEQPKPKGYAGRQIARARAEAVEPELAEMNARHAMVKYGGRVRVLVERSDGLPEFLKKAELFDWYANRTVKVAVDKDGNDVKKPLAEWWIKHPQRRDFERVEFMPGVESPDGVYNLWRGPAVVPAPGDCGLFLDLIRDVIAAGDGEVYEYLLNWMALKFQQPGAKLETSIALRGGQGVGKSLFAEKFGELFGRHFVAVSDQKGLMGNFNAHLQQALLVFADEIAAAKNANMVGRLKTLVTQTHIRIEPKGVDSFAAPNHFAVILASNNPHIVATDADDRRWLVLDVSPARRGDRTFFRALVEQWQAGGREAFAHLLMQRDLSGFEHRDRPQTAALAEQVESSFTGAARVIHEMLASGETPEIWRNGEPVDVPEDGGRVFIPSGALAKAAVASGKIQRGEAAGLEKSLGHQLKKLGRVQRTEQVSIAGKTARGVWLPTLAVARDWWSEMHGRAFDWGDDPHANWDVVRVPTAKDWGDEMPF
ncbi:Virulence-associated protein E [Marinovum algicola]|uniref:Virulence-associated protein E n=1 Tax=Marinovum algicola TaxID=42444 RepID=A0A975WA92_9RHOB|nr:Virulence-associated protein E [Marinovum algicola]SLN32630.1 Virulence-associated protein E [Marinovum algicola]